MKCNFTPMDKFYQILDYYGLSYTEIKKNHIRVFYGNKKLFDYYPLRMKLFDYHEWHQLTYPFVKGKEDEWEVELIMFISGVLGDEMFKKFKND